MRGSSLPHLQEVLRRGGGAAEELAVGHVDDGGDVLAQEDLAEVVQDLWW